MKHYIIYVDGEEVEIIKASGHNRAEAIAKRKYPRARTVWVAYTEL